MWFVQYASVKVLDPEFDTGVEGHAFRSFSLSRAVANALFANTTLKLEMIISWNRGSYAFIIVFLAGLVF